jgi:predicted  nucleic acid-binding Zn-ribbon protein
MGDLKSDNPPVYSAEDARKQQAQIQLQVVGLGGVGVRAHEDNLCEGDKLRAELTAQELEQRQKGNAETCQRVVSTLQKKFSEIDRESRKLAFVKAELAKLDNSLSNNISVLRTEIEKVGREEADAQADFDAREKAYLASRKDLAKKKTTKTIADRPFGSHYSEQRTSKG